jgi:hypothetical protein
MSPLFRLDLMRLRRTTKHENGLLPRSHSKIFVFNAVKFIFIAGR